MEQSKAARTLARLQRMQADIGRRIDKSVLRDDYSEVLHLESVYKKLALQIARLRRSVGVSQTQ